MFFDNLQVTDIRGPLVEETHYYPFGHAMVGISSKALLQIRRISTSTTAKKNRGRSLAMEVDWSGWIMVPGFMMLSLEGWHAQDPFAKNFEYESPYSYAGNDPVRYIDVAGKFKFPNDQMNYIKGKYPTFYKYISSESGIVKLAENERIISTLAKYSLWKGREKALKDEFKWDNGAEIGFLQGGLKGHTDPNSKNFAINEKFLELIEESKGEDRDVL